jgi:hypothetical protein
VIDIRANFAKACDFIRRKIGPDSIVTDESDMQYPKQPEERTSTCRGMVTGCREQDAKALVSIRLRREPGPNEINDNEAQRQKDPQETTSTR